jgi:hypothetical protein
LTEILMPTEVKWFLARGFSFAALTGLTLVFAPGCSSLGTSGDTIATHRRGQTEEPGTAPSDGDYLLMYRYLGSAPLEYASLSRGDRLGFATAKTGQITAIAGDDEWTYTDNDYVWVRKRR